MSVDLSLLKQLREETQAPLKDCKETLIEANGDIVQAKELLKKKGALQAAKKSDRETNEGLVKVVSENGRIMGIKLACETDFVAKNDMFGVLLDLLLDALKSYDKDFSTLSEIDETFLNEKLTPIVQDGVGKVGENLKLLDAFISSENGYVYIHPGSKVASVVFYNGGDDNSSSIAKEIALQIAAMNPSYLSVSDVPTDELNKLKEGFQKEMEGSNKPADIVEKIIEGKLSKSYSEFVLLEQLYIRDESKKIKDLIPSNMTVVGYKRVSI